jgi:hypothetical protein
MALVPFACECCLGFQALLNRPPIGLGVADEFVSQMPESTTCRVYRAVEIEMNVPLSWVLIHIKEVKRRFRPVRLVKTAACTLVTGETPGEILSSGKCGFNHWPRGKFNSNTALPVNID